MQQYVVEMGAEMTKTKSELTKERKKHWIDICKIETEKRFKTKTNFASTAFSEPFLFILPHPPMNVTNPWAMHFSSPGVPATFSSWSWSGAPLGIPREAGCDGRIAACDPHAWGGQGLWRPFPGLLELLFAELWVGRKVGWLAKILLYHRFKKFLSLLWLPVQRCFCFLTVAQFTSIAQTENWLWEKNKDSPEHLVWRKKLQDKSLVLQSFGLYCLNSHSLFNSTSFSSVLTTDWNGSVRVILSFQITNLIGLFLVLISFNSSWSLISLTILFSLKCIFFCLVITSFSDSPLSPRTLHSLSSWFPFFQ